jgi:bacillithiol system protein YtxJ
MTLLKIGEDVQFDEVIKGSKKLLFLKNSTTCPVSEAAFNEFKQFAEEHDEETFYYLNVQEARSLSNHIAEQFDVKHQSPQVLLFVNGEVAWHDSHWKITNDTLKEKWA